ncbi:phosphonate metabolism protein/1,5-bisphosphokinase (PRPP-forming) PhnN [Roseomonas sp. GCM10028921]
MSGRLVAVVGPSGAGKDTLMEAARAALAGDPGFAFLRRVVTRPADAGGEDHIAATRESFAAMREAGEFALWWEAHGLLYGVPGAPLEAVLAAGGTAVVNLSRAMLPEASERFPLRVLEITAPLPLRAERLASRGRESLDEVRRRLTRQAPLPPGLAVETVVNDRSLDEGVARVLAGLRAA